MPFINVISNVAADADAVKTALGEAITAIPGKSEAWLMVNVEKPSDLYFKGSNEPCAMFDVGIFGSASDSAYDDLTARICQISENILKVPAARTYVKYSEYAHWGWNNMNF